MVDFEIERNDYVRLPQFPDIVFRVEYVQYNPPPPLTTNRNPWAPRAYIHFACGPKQFAWSLLARWEPLCSLVKLQEMEVLARFSR